jgi:hypothetical protein
MKGDSVEIFFRVNVEIITLFSAGQSPIQVHRCRAADFNAKFLFNFCSEKKTLSRNFKIGGESRRKNVFPIKIF